MLFTGHSQSPNDPKNVSIISYNKKLDSDILNMESRAHSKLNKPTRTNAKILLKKPIKTIGHQR